jgi:quercetin dioxygenase-like cupin family protein
MSDRFEDHRGVIEDLLGRIDAVTKITTVKDAVRGNHVHYRTTQWTYVVEGQLVMAHGDTHLQVAAGQMTKEKPGVPHAWKAVEDTVCLVFTLGPRSGAEYESDTIRLEEPLL